MAFATEQEARDYYAGAEAEGLAVEVAMGAAANMVASLAPPPAELEADPGYFSAARLGELLVGRYLWNTEGGTLSSEGISGISTSYVKFPEVQSLVAGAMGSYYKSPTVARGGLRSVELERG